MGRSMEGHDDELFRAVIVYTDDGGGTYTYVRGPFTTKAAARSVITSAVRRNSSRSNWHRGFYGATSVEGHVERTATTWERVE